MMAFDAKAIKEEVTDKDTYETITTRRLKGNKDRCRTPDSPESARAIAPKSPISPHHHNTLAPQRSSRNGSSSPIVNGASTPPPASSAATPHATTATSSVHQDPGRALSKVKRFLGALVQFGQDISSDIGDRVRALILSLASGGLTSDEFKIALQEATNFPLRPYVLPFLKTHIPFLQREISNLARASNQSTLQYVRNNESSALEFPHPTEHADIFLPIEPSSTNGGSNGGPTMNGNGMILKRRTSESFFDHQNGPHEWNDYLMPSKRPHMMFGTNNIFPNHPPLFDYQTGNTHSESYTNLLDKVGQGVQRGGDDRDIRSGGGGGGSGCVGGMINETHRNNRLGGEEEWKNIHTMLNCISAMVDKTKRAITILQQRGIEAAHPQYTEPTFTEIKRQTEEKVAEFKRSAEEAVNQVKRQAVVEIQRAVAAAENRAMDAIAQERLKIEKMYSEMSKTTPEESEATQATAQSGTQNVCWNCGRKANETCSGCNLARYCGAFCQHKDWEQHHQICGTSRLETSTAKHSPHYRITTGGGAAVPPSRTSPGQQQSVVSITNGISPAAVSK